MHLCLFSQGLHGWLPGAVKMFAIFLGFLQPSFAYMFRNQFVSSGLHLVSYAMEAAAGPNCDLSTTVQPGMLTNAGDLTMDLQMLSIQRNREQVLGHWVFSVDFLGCRSTWHVCSMVCGFLWMGWGCLSADAGMKCFVVAMAIFFSERKTGRPDFFWSNQDTIDGSDIPFPTTWDG